MNVAIKSVTFWSAVLLAVSDARTVRAQAASPELEQQVRFFESEIRPLLAEHCYRCHGADTQESELRLDTHEGLLRGGASGKALLPGRPDQSLMMLAVRYDDDDLRMPPDKRLTDRQVAKLARWIESGAHHPDGSGAAIPPEKQDDWDERVSHWAFQPPKKTEIPQVADTTWPRTPVDNFVLAGLRARGLVPNPEADRRVLIRRATIDLLGIPPTPEQVADFVADDSPDAFERVVDRLLASVEYGRRWGRHWLDVTRYADSNGLDENVAHGNAWRYRDYVIESLNEDKPYDRFVVEQVAGDLLTDDGASPGEAPERSSPDADARRRRRLIATGFLSLGPKVLAEGDEQKMVMDIVDEQVDTIGRALLGLTLGCARCHDHKFDPIRTEGYYALAGILRGTRTMSKLTRIAEWNENSIATPEQVEAKQNHEAEIAAVKARIESTIDEARRTSAEKPDVSGDCSPPPSQDESSYPEATRATLERLRARLKMLEGSTPVLPTAMGVTEGEVGDLRVHLRGNHRALGDVVPRGLPQVLSPDAPLRIAPDSSGRLELARWLVDRRNPLTARVIVNRVWRWHFGRGIVRSTDNFGLLGQRPDNQPLLDWTALYLMDNGWSLKSLHRVIVLSSTYRMDSRADASTDRVDPDNRAHWRAETRRLEAEALRDSILSVSGLLDRAHGGSLLELGNREFVFDHTSKDRTTYDSRRRAVYLPVIRNHLYDMFSLFDYSDASVPQGDRTTSTAATQAMFLMNGDLVLEAADALARRIGREGSSPRGRVGRLYRLAYSREPSEAEIERDLRFVKSVEQEGESTDRAWSALCQTILCSNEFIYVR